EAGRPAEGQGALAAKAALLEGRRAARVVRGRRQGSGAHLGGGARALPAGDAPSAAPRDGGGDARGGATHRGTHGGLRARGHAVRDAGAGRIQASRRPRDAAGVDSRPLTVCRTFSLASDRSLSLSPRPSKVTSA